MDEFWQLLIQRFQLRRLMVINLWNLFEYTLLMLQLANETFVGVCG